MRDRDIRAAVVERLAGEHAGTPHLLIGEVEVRDTGRRMDLLLINSRLTAIEIKSDVDSLTRLPGQVEAYGRVAERAVLVTGAKHFQAALRLLPDWWEVWVASADDSSSVTVYTEQTDPAPFVQVRLRKMRRGRANPELLARALAGLLLRHELECELRCLGAAVRGYRGVHELRDELTNAMSLRQLRQRVREVLLRRPEWRARAASVGAIAVPTWPPAVLEDRDSPLVSID